jgi:thiol-disulfide isomerase/thioredoxin
MMTHRRSSATRGMERTRAHAPRPAATVAVLLAIASLADGGSARAARLAGLGAGAEQASAALDRHPLKMIDGGTVTLGSLRGQVVVVNFWATWCPPCRRELPRLDRLNAEIASRGGRVMAISIDRDPENVRRYAKARSLSLPIAQDGPDGLARELDLEHVPLTLIIDRDGGVALAISGSGDDSLARLADEVHRLLARPPAASSALEGSTR